MAEAIEFAMLTDESRNRRDLIRASIGRLDVEIRSNDKTMQDATISARSPEEYRSRIAAPKGSNDTLVGERDRLRGMLARLEAK